jgi:hypothetical protein
MSVLVRTVCRTAGEGDLMGERDGVGDRSTTGSRRGAGRRVRLLHDVGVRRWRTGALVHERDLERVHPVMQATRVARSRLRRGTVLLARVPFRDQDRGECQDKVRPVVVVSVSGDEVVCRPCSSAVSRFRYPWLYTEVHDLSSAGLTRPTGVRLGRIVLPIDACIDVCGSLAEDDLARLWAVGAAVMPDGQERT